MIIGALALAVLLPLHPPAQNPQAAPVPPSLHAPWTALLREHVRNDLVDYDAFAKAPSFQEYLQALRAARLESMSRAERLAFWINVYNAYTIALVNKHNERESIQNINMLLGMVRTRFKGPWKEDIVLAAGRKMTLEDVEKLIRSEFREPRVHMALVKAAMSSPPLRGEAYEGARLNEQLEDQTRTFLRERQVSNRLDLGNQLIHLSQIFDWYRDDFGKSDDAILKFVAPYFEGRAEKSAFATSRLIIEFGDFDWRLNLLQPRETQ